MIPIESYNSLSLKQLHNLCRYHSLAGYSNMRIKSQLVVFIYDQQLDIPDFILYEKKRKVGRPMGSSNRRPIDPYLYMEKFTQESTEIYTDNVLPNECLVVNS